MYATRSRLAERERREESRHAGARLVKLRAHHRAAATGRNPGAKIGAVVLTMLVDQCLAVRPRLRRKAKVGGI